MCDALAREGAATQGAHAEGTAAAAEAPARANAWSAESREVSVRLRAKDAELDYLATQKAQAQERLAQEDGVLAAERAGLRRGWRTRAWCGERRRRRP